MFDPAVDDEDVRDARHRVLEGDWEAAPAVVEAAGTDWERRSHRVAVLADAAGDDDRWLGTWLALYPHHPAAAAVEAEMWMVRAAEGRGARPAADTTREQFHVFHTLSERARSAARRAISLDPTDPGPRSTLLWTILGRAGGDPGEFATALYDARTVDPFHFDTNVVALTYYCAKWYGSHERMFATAREVAVAAPPGSAVVMLPLLAHVERVLRDHLWPGRDDEAAARAYFQRPAVQEQLDYYIGKWLHPGPPTHALTHQVRNWQALFYCLAGRRDQARAVFDEIGSHAHGHAWGYFGMSSASRNFIDWRDWAYQSRVRPPL